MARRARGDSSIEIIPPLAGMVLFFLLSGFELLIGISLKKSSLLFNGRKAFA
jgi:hypothetical protein